MNEDFPNIIKMKKKGKVATLKYKNTKTRNWVNELEQQRKIKR